MTVSNHPPNFHPELIRAVWVDVDQTLVDFNASAKLALKEVFEEFHFPFSNRVFDVFLEENEKLWVQVEDGTISRPEFHAIRFPRIFEALEIPLEHPAEFEDLFLTKMHEIVLPVKGAKECLVCFRRLNLPVFAATNGPAAGQKERIEKAGLSDWIEDAFSSQEAGAQKPELKFFEYGLKQTEHALQQSLSSEQIVMIGDGWKTDIKGAFHAGMQAIWLTAARADSTVYEQMEKQVFHAGSWKEIEEAFCHEREDLFAGKKTDSGSALAE